MRAAATGAAKVRVLVRLRMPAALAASGKPDIGAARAQVASEQRSVLSGVTPADFEVTYQYQALPALAGVVTEKGLVELAARPDVEQITLDDVGHAADAQSTPLIHADDAHTAGVTGAGVTVAVLDTGIDTNHPDLSDDIAYERCFLAGGGCPGAPHVAEDNNGHGTNVAGIITGKGTIAPIGIAPDARIAAYKILGSDGSGLFSDWGAALDDIIANHPEVDIINMSLQSPFACPSGVLADAITTLHSSGVLTFIAAGNLGSKNTLYIPACIPDAISVGATYDNDVGQISGWKTSCTDNTTAADQVTCWSSSDNTLDLLAPGARITSTGNGGGSSTYMGTSQASPTAAGVAALLEDALPGLSAAEVESRMKLSGTILADDLHDNDGNTFRRTPRVDARVALITDDNADDDGDGCPNGKEFGPNQTMGGQRNPLSPWDYFNPTHDGINQTDDILAVVHQYGKSKYLPPPAAPNTPNPAYTAATDRSPNGPKVWNLGPPDGMQRVDDILAAVGQYGHNCS